MQWQGSYGRKVGKETNTSSTRNKPRSFHAFHKLSHVLTTGRLSTRKTWARQNWPKEAYTVRMPSRSASSFKSCTVSCAELPGCFPLVQVPKTSYRQHGYIIFILYRDRFGTKFYNMAADHSLSRQLKTNPSPAIHAKYTKCRATSNLLISFHIMHHCICLQLLCYRACCNLL